MHLLLLTAGTRGDVDPFLALARRAAAEGHAVTIGVTREFVGRARVAGLDVAELDGDYARLVAAQGVSPWRALRTLRTVVRPMMGRILRSAAEAVVAAGPDVVVAHPKVLSAPLAAARVGARYALVEIVPAVTPTRAFPAAGVTTVDLGPANRLTFRATAAAGSMFASELRGVRSDLGLDGLPVPPPGLTLVPISPTLLERPADWPASTTITGQWRLPPDAADGGRPLGDAELDAFLGRGGVVYAGFGSMATGDPAERARTVVRAARATGRPVLVATGWGGLRVPDDVAGDDVLVRSDVPHELVLSRCDVAIHHGGAGTTHAVVRAGVRSVPVPFLGDQPFWARLLHRRGLGTAPIPARRLTTRRLASALDALPDPAAVEGAAEAMAGEDGCGVALELLAGG